MASCKAIRRLALLHHARGFCNKQDALLAHHFQPRSPLQADHFQPRSLVQLVAALEDLLASSGKEYVTSSGKLLLASLTDFMCYEKDKLLQKEESLQKLHLQKEESLRKEEESLQKLHLQKEESLRKEVEYLQKLHLEKEESLKKVELSLQEKLLLKDTHIERLAAQITALEKMAAHHQVALLQLKGLNK